MEQFLDAVVGVLWGPTLLVGLLGTGLYFSVITRFWQIRHFFDSVKFCFFPDHRGEMLPADKSRVTPYQAACVAIAGSIGSGNIGGVAGAIALGGPGVIFWMWMTALVGMMTKMAEVTLAVYYRKIDETGKKTGGPLFYIEKGIGKYKFWKILSVLFTLGIFMQLILAPEAYTVGESLHEITGIRVIHISFRILLSDVCVSHLGRLKEGNRVCILYDAGNVSFVYRIWGLYHIGEHKPSSCGDSVNSEISVYACRGSRRFRRSFFHADCAYRDRPRPFQQ